MLKNILDGKCIFHNSRDGSIFFAFKEKQFFPEKLIKIYDKSKKEKLLTICRLLKEINNHGSGPLKDSVPQILYYTETGAYCVVFEEFIEGIAMERYSERKSFFWKKDFLKNLELVTCWLSHFHKNFVIKKATITGDSIAYAREETRVFLQPSFLNMPEGDIEIPLVMSHFDLRPSNIIRRKDKIVIIDWYKLKMEQLPLLDLLEFILLYFHSHYKFQKTGMLLEPGIILKYFDLMYLKKSRLSEGIKEKIKVYCDSLNLRDEERDFLILLWLHANLYQCRDTVYPFYENV